MKTQNGFTLMNKNEIASYLAKQSVTRLQVYHMDLPNYSTWEKTFYQSSLNHTLIELNH